MDYLALSDGTYDAIWKYGTIAMFSIFAVFETWAFIDGKSKRNTFSGWVWRQIGTREGWNKKTTVPRILTGLFLLWLFEHFVFGWF
jgi:hypothetical protein